MLDDPLRTLGWGFDWPTGQEGKARGFDWDTESVDPALVDTNMLNSPINHLTHRVLDE